MSAERGGMRPSSTAASGPDPGSQSRTSIVRRVAAALWEPAAVLLVLVVSLSAVRWGQEDESPTTDEWAHFVRGLAYWQTGDPRLSFAHPPLANLVTAAPAAFSDDLDLPRVEDLEAWHTTMDPGGTSVELLDSAYADTREGLMRGRMATGWLLILGVAYLYVTLAQTYGRGAAMLASIFVGWNPTVVAQARYVTTDLAAAITIAIATLELLRFSSRPLRRGAWLRPAIAVSIALATKHSAVVLLVLAPLVLVGAAVARKGVFANVPRARAVRRAATWLAAGGLVAVVGINVAYSCSSTFERVDTLLERAEPEYWISAPHDGQMLDRSALKHLPAWFRVPLPRHYVFGLVCVSEQMRVGYPRGVFRGEPNPSGHPLYFPLLLLLKTPVCILGSLFVGFVALAARRGRAPLALWLLVLSALWLTAPLVASRLNMGIRHALPQVLLLSITSAVLLDWVWRESRRPRRRVWAAVVGTALAGSSAVSLVRAGPHYLGWFNELSSREAGLAVSPVGDDWGQDTGALATAAKEAGVPLLFYYDPTRTRHYELEHFGVRVRVIACKTNFRATRRSTVWVAVHLHELQLGDACFPWRDQVVGEDWIRGHIALYEVEIGPGQRGSTR